MKIVHIVRGDFNPSALNGVYKVIDSLSSSLACHEGIDVVVCSVGELGVEIFKPKKYTHVRVAESKALFPITRSFKNFIKQYEPDTIFHFHSVFIPWFLQAVKYLHRNGYHRIVLTPHGQYTDVPMRQSFKKRTFFHFFDSKVIRLASAVHLIGHTEENRYILKNAKKYELIPNGCDHIGKTTEVMHRDLVFGYLGRLEIAQKGLDTLLHSFLKYKDAGGKGQLRLAGGGADEEKLKAISAASAHRNSIVFQGVVSGKMKWQFLSECAFFCHPSRWDVYPTAALEAASCGVPLIVTSATNMDATVGKYNAGAVLKDKEVEDDLADVFFQMESLFYRKADYDAMSDNAVRMLQQELNWDIIASKVIEQLYKTI